MTGMQSGSRGGKGPGARLGVRGRIRTRALLLTTLALAFYLGFIALTIYRSHR
jgi:hypothetical protein